MLKFSASARLWLGWLLCCLSAVMQAQAKAVVPMAIWMWEQDSEEMLKNPAQAKEMVGFLKRRKMDTLYL